MPGVYINNWVTLELLCQTDAQLVETVFNYQSTNQPIAEGDLLAFVTTWQAAMQTLLQPCLSDQVLLQKVRAKTHFPAGIPNTEAEKSFPSGTGGTVTGGQESNNVASAVKLGTGYVGRQNRGRQYMFGIAKQHCLGSSVVSGYISNVAALFTRHLIGFTANGITYIPAVASRKGLRLRPLVEFTQDNLLDSQRRRLIGRGR